MPTHQEIDAQIDALINNLGLEEIAPCQNTGKTCLEKAHELPVKNGKIQFWYGITCPVPAKSFCHGCAAYWLVQVARNEWTALQRDIRLEQHGIPVVKRGE